MFSFVKKVFQGNTASKNGYDQGEQGQIQQPHLKKKDEDDNLQILEFQIDPMENLPRLYVFNGKPEEEQVDYIPPSMQQYSDSYDNIEKIQRSNSDENQQILDTDGNEIKFTVYKVTPKDTLYLISDKFGVNVGKIMKFNGLSGDHIFPGMNLKIPELGESNKMIIQEKDESIDESKDSKVKIRRGSSLDTISNELIDHQKLEKTYICFYCTGYGNIKGKLEVTDNFVNFHPDTSDPDNINIVKKRSFKKFAASIDVYDINEAMSMCLPPNANEINVEENQKDYAVQISLSTINKDIQQKYHDKINKLKQQKKSISFVTFKIYEYNIHGNVYTDYQKKLISDYIVDDISELIENHGEISKRESQTIVPFYDILYNNLIDNDEHDDVEGKEKGSKKKEKKLSIWEKLGVTPNIPDKSEIISKDMLLQIIQDCVPSVFQLAQFRLLYSNWLHGTSINTCYRNSEDISPVILIVEEFNGNFFGAYLSDPLQSGFNFYGKGECCVFSIHKKPKKTVKKDDESEEEIVEESKQEDEDEEEEELELSVYEATGDNNNYIFCDHEGIGIGCGDRYAIFIKHTLTSGNSNPSSTFDNPRLATKEDFQIKHIEVWGIE